MKTMNEISMEQLENVIGGTMISLHRFPGKTSVYGRIAPFQLGAVKAELTHGTAVEILDTQTNNDIEWCKVRIKKTGEIVWVNSLYIS